MSMKKLKEFSRVLPPCSDPPEDTSMKGVDDGRQKWERPIEFLFSCIAMCVGLGNVWRFPFTAFKNGGGAFLIPYFIVLFLIGKPLYFLELAIGQFSSRGQVKVWKLSPIFKGVGYASAFATCCISSYYCMLMAVAIFYFIASFSSVLPWTVCNDDWEGIRCENGTAWGLEDSTNGSSELKERSIPSLYFKQTVLHEKRNIDDGIGIPDWRLTLCLLFSWLLLFIVLARGVRSAGKAAYFTALFPYVVLIILLIRGVTLEGAWTGIQMFIEPQWGALLDLNVWYAAVTQCFFSLTVGTGATIMLASYNRFDHNLYRDAAIITLMDTFTSLLAGCTIFSVLGNLSHELGVPIQNVTEAEVGLAFVAYPQAIAKFGWAPQLFAVLFFLMLFTLGIGSSTSDVGGIITVIHDRFPKWNKTYIAGAVCTSGFLLGLVYVTPGGFMILDLVDVHGVGFVIFITAAMEVIAVSWVYGLKNICRDLEFMLKIKLSWYWKICWGFITPVSLSVLLVYELIHFQPLEGYPMGATIAGWVLSAIAIIIFPVSALHVIVTRPGETWKEKLSNSWKPADTWGPSILAIKQKWATTDRATDSLL